MIKVTGKKRFINLSLIYLLADIVILAVSFFIFIWIKPATIDFYFPRYIKPFIFFGFLWVFISSLIGKYRLHDRKELNDIFAVVTFSNITIIAIVTSLLFLFNRFGYSRMIVFGTIIISTLIEYLVSFIAFSISNAKLVDENIARLNRDENDESSTENIIGSLNELKNSIISDTDEKVFNLAFKHISDMGVYLNRGNIRINDTQFIDIDVNHIIDLYSVNGIYGISKYFSSQNLALPLNGIYIGRVETYNNRKQRILNRIPFPINRADYFIDFIFTRVLPKLLFTRGIYFFFFRNRDRVLSKAETFGRLYAAGFDVVDELIVNSELFYVAKKIKRPYILQNPSYGFLITLRRHGKGGKMFKVYKLRTMHAFAEYLQEYVYKKHNLQEGGKFKDDFRITPIGKFLRKFWIDELPMIINLFKGDMKLVGVRPLSSHYFNLYSEALKEKRIKYKPGLIPPFYVDLPKSFNEIMESEMKYLIEYEKSHFLTDWKYFWKAIYNIFVKRVRGK